MRAWSRVGCLVRARATLRNCHAHTDLLKCLKPRSCYSGTKSQCSERGGWCARRRGGTGPGGGGAAKQAPVPGSAPDLGASSAAQQGATEPGATRSRSSGARPSGRPRTATTARRMTWRLACPIWVRSICSRWSCQDRFDMRDSSRCLGAYGKRVGSWKEGMSKLGAQQMHA